LCHPVFKQANRAKNFLSVSCSIELSNGQHKLGDVLLLLVFHLSLGKCVIFKDIFQGYPGPGIFKKKIQDFSGGVGTL